MVVVDTSQFELIFLKDGKLKGGNKVARLQSFTHKEPIWYYITDDGFSCMDESDSLTCDAAYSRIGRGSGSYTPKDYPKDYVL